MKMHSAEVKSSRDKNGKIRADKKQVVVGSVDFPQYDSLDEAAKAITETKALNLINAQIATNAKNEFRAEAVGGVSEGKLKNEAFVRICANPSLAARMATASSDSVAVEALISEVVAQIKTERGLDTPEVDETAPA